MSSLHWCMAHGTRNFYTEDGLHKVFAIDLLARHCVMSTTAQSFKWHCACHVRPCIIAKATKSPKKEALQSLLSDGMRLEGMYHWSRTWLQAWYSHCCRYLASVHAENFAPNAHVMVTFPGILVSELMSSSFPGWVVPILKLIHTPLADSDEVCGLHHEIILSSSNITRKQVCSGLHRDLRHMRLIHLSWM